jgi:hypothetical protein
VAEQQETLTAEYDRDTTKGKRRYRIENGVVSGTLYIAPDDPRAKYDKLVVELKPAV